MTFSTLPGIRGPRMPMRGHGPLVEFQSLPFSLLRRRKHCYLLVRMEAGQLLMVRLEHLARRVNHSSCQVMYPGDIRPPLRRSRGPQRLQLYILSPHQASAPIQVTLVGLIARSDSWSQPGTSNAQVPDQLPEAVLTDASDTLRTEADQARAEPHVIEPLSSSIQWQMLQVQHEVRGDLAESPETMHALARTMEASFQAMSSAQFWSSE
ncbi:uncharacterized protein [Heterodontus francisci]|uniref:uncharacterized protein isoform X1 n=1 Tax=Heterodontus francisci TaxID=7792 RepID=UPI00355C9B0C